VKNIFGAPVGCRQSSHFVMGLIKERAKNLYALKQKKQLQSICVHASKPKIPPIVMGLTINE
jgi:hypothetical protein